MSDPTPDDSLTGPAARQKIQDLVSAGDACFFCTHTAATAASGGWHARPMSVRAVDEGGILWFFTARDSVKEAELQHDPRVTLFFQRGDHGGHLRLDGTVTTSTDRDLIHRLWSPLLRAWFTEGADDPRIAVLRVEPHHGEYWDHRYNAAITGLQLLFGAVTATRVDEGVHGQLQP